jgi:aspartyl protease family protein
MTSQETNPQSFSRRMGKGMIYLMWLVVLGGLTYFFSGWLDAERNPNRTVVSRVTSDGVSETVLDRNRYGHYVASGKINGQRVRFLLDTGASDVNIPARVADRLGLAYGSPIRATTANGEITIFATRLDSVELGSIQARGVRASINPHMAGDEILLGMTFLKDLEIVQRGKQLTLRTPPDQVR